MIFGVGIDIIDPKRIEGTIAPGDSFLRRTFTGAEREAAPEGEAARLEWYAGRFAIKEAVFKALRDDAPHTRMDEIEALRAADGSPYIILHGRTKDRAAGKGIAAVHVSLSKESGFVCALAVAEK